ncbi:MAG: hypothetical protein IJS94_06225, partial [Clostridia bacterium]|nr:hypothetical protein [Clostridia bacterium]
NADKITDGEYFILTLAGIAMELNSYGLTEANVHLAAGLPLKWISQQKKAFSDYLLRVPDVRFTFNRKNYHVRITGVNIFPQGFAAIQDKTATMNGMTVLCDIGNGIGILGVFDHLLQPVLYGPESCGCHVASPRISPMISFAVCFLLSISRAQISSNTRSAAFSTSGVGGASSI